MKAQFILPFTPYISMMAVSPSAIAVYNQIGFVPEELMSQWSAAGFMIGPIVEWLALDMTTVNAMVAHAGFTMGSHVSMITGVTLEEWEEMLGDPAIGRVNLATKALLRQLMTSCRCVMGLNIHIDPVAPTTTIIQQAPAAPAPPVINELLQVKVGNIARQGNESKVELVSWEKVEQGRANFKKKDGLL